MLQIWRCCYGYAVSSLTSCRSNSFQDATGFHWRLGISHKRHQVVRRHSRAATARYSWDRSDNSLDKDCQTWRRWLCGRSLSFRVSTPLESTHSYTDGFAGTLFGTDAIQSRCSWRNWYYHEYQKSFSLRKPCVVQEHFKLRICIESIIFFSKKLTFFQAPD